MRQFNTSWYRTISKAHCQDGGGGNQDWQKSLYNKYDCIPMERIQETEQPFPFVLRN